MAKTKKKTNVTILSRTPKIEKGIPVPPQRGGGEFEFMSKMEVGDSFFLSRTQWDLKLALSSARAVGYRCGFKMRSVTEDNGARIWRVA